MNIRKATEGDIPAVLRLLGQISAVHEQGRPDIFKAVTKYSRDDLIRIFDSDETPVFVADDSGVVGYAFCVVKTTVGNRLMHDSKMIYIDDLCVDESERGKGVGRQIFEYVEKYAKSIGCDSITLNVWEFNAAARRFYEARGMSPQKTVMEKKI